MGNTKSKHLMPVQQDQGRLDAQHAAVRKLLHGNFQAPMEESLQRGIRVLDAGCGIGKWTLDMAADFPASKFTGVDINKVLPKSTLPNCNFVHADIFKLPFPNDTFDFVFQSPKDWANAVKELIRVTKPGGWIECMEFNYAMERMGPNVQLIVKAVDKACEARGIQIHISQKLGQFVSGSLENLVVDHVTMPFGWNGRVGEICAENFITGMLMMGDKLSVELKMTEEEFRQLLERASAEFGEQRTWTKLPYIYGMKPLPHSQQAS